MDLTVDQFAAAVGSVGDVTVTGLATRAGGVPGVRAVSAPAGITRVDAAEMVVECGAATPMDELAAALAEHGQTVSMPVSGTVGGALAVGLSDLTRLGHGPMRDVLLQTHYVAASGKATKAGGPTVKNVSGFDLCRLLVGARGTLGFFGDVILRTRPVPRYSRWFTSAESPVRLLESLYRPVSMLWDGTTTWIRLDGDPIDIGAAQQRHGLTDADGPPPLPSKYRWSVRPSELVTKLGTSTGSFIAEIGVGVVHHSEPPPRRDPDQPTRELHQRIKVQFDPSGRLNPGIDPFGIA